MFITYMSCFQEHKCVLDSCRALEAEGFKVTYLPVNTNGIISLEGLDKAIQEDTSLVSIMTVNNEIGVKQPISEIGKNYDLFYYVDLLKKFLINIQL